MKRTPIDVGYRFCRLVTLAYQGVEESSRRRLWKVVCDCGTEKVVRENGLKTGNTKSCGCLNLELAAKRVTKYGKGATPESQVWRDIKKRCLNPSDPNFHHYGGRGITICGEWRDDFLKFLEDVGPRPFQGATLDRIDNSRGYEPGNTRWVTMRVQQRNKRTNLLIEIGGDVKTLIEWSEIYRLDKGTAHGRVKRAEALGIPVHEALSCSTEYDAFKKLEVKYGYHPY